MTTFEKEPLFYYSEGDDMAEKAAIAADEAGKWDAFIESCELYRPTDEPSIFED